ncbi:hypothetical protein HAX54_024204, partial [Datura stramonium]|nr:hypothetical protein [Datura stramonium]
CPRRGPTDFFPEGQAVVPVLEEVEGGQLRWFGLKGRASLFDHFLRPVWMSVGKFGIHYRFLLGAAHPLSLKGRSRRSKPKGQRVIFEGYYASLFIVECK